MTEHRPPRVFISSTLEDLKTHRAKAAEAADATPDQMLARVEELEVMCDSCHETYRTEFDYLDFDRLEDFLD